MPAGACGESDDCFEFHLHLQIPGDGKNWREELNWRIEEDERKSNKPKKGEKWGDKKAENEKNKSDIDLREAETKGQEETVHGIGL